MRKRRKRRQGAKAGRWSWIDGKLIADGRGTGVSLQGVASESADKCRGDAMGWKAEGVVATAFVAWGASKNDSA